MFSIDDYDYHLPAEQIAQHPADRRDHSRLLVLDRERGRIAHRRFHDLPNLLAPGDVLVVNDTRVVAGRLYGRKPTGGRVELLLLDYADCVRRKTAGLPVEGRCLLRAAKPTRPGTILSFDHGLTAEVLGGADGVHTVRFDTDGADFEVLVDRIGRMPLPPYIRRGSQDVDNGGDRQSYQTVYAAQKGAVAAPTAGLHFTDSLLARIGGGGVQIVRLTLHVGYGTFLPVRVTDIRDHRMHAEWFELSEESAARINAARAAGGRVVAVGTTCVRTLEACSEDDGRLAANTGECDLFIYPGYRFKAVDAMITNFHLPRSTLLMLVSAFAGREAIFAAYAEAINEDYRFYSYGDAMVVL